MGLSTLRRLQDQTRAQDAVSICFQSVARIEIDCEIGKIAADREEGIDDLVSKMIDVLSTEKTLIENLLEEEEPTPRRRGRKNAAPVGDE